MEQKTLNSIKFIFTIDGKAHSFDFTIDKEVKEEDTEAIGVVMQKWITESLKRLI